MQWELELQGLSSSGIGCSSGRGSGGSKKSRRVLCSVVVVVVSGRGLCCRGQLSAVVVVVCSRGQLSWSWSAVVVVAEVVADQDLQ